MRTRFMTGLISGPLMLFLSGCGSTPPIPIPEETKPVIPAKIAGSNIGPDSRERIRFDENIKVYPVGRYIDPNNSKIMYEKTTMYRIEEDNVWNLRPNQPYTLPAEEQERRKRLTDAEKPLISELNSQLEFIKKTTAQTSEQQRQLEILRNTNQLQLKINEQMYNYTKDLKKDSQDLKNAIGIISKKIEEINNAKQIQTINNGMQNDITDENDWKKAAKNIKVKLNGGENIDKNQ